MLVRLLTIFKLLLLGYWLLLGYFERNTLAVYLSLTTLSLNPQNVREATVANYSSSKEDYTLVILVSLNSDYKI